MRIVFLFTLLLSSHFASAQYSGGYSSSVDYSTSLWQRSHFLSLVLDNWTYKEPRIKDSGLLYGVHYAYRDLFLQNKLYMEFNAEYLRGETKYDGVSITGNIPITSDQNNTVYKGEVWLGTQIETTSGLGFIPKVGFMYRKLIDADDPAGGDYQRDQEYFVIPVGLDFFMPLSVNKLVFSAFVSVNFKGKNKTYFSDVGGSPDHTFNQDEGSGMGLEITYLVVPYTMTVFYRSWEVADSEAKFGTLPPPTGSGFFHEPENDTKSFGLRLGFTF